MIKVSGSIVDTNFNLIGLEVSGKASDFGGIGPRGKEEVHSYRLLDLARINLRTSILSVKMVDGIAEVVYADGNPARLRDLPMKLLTESGLVPISNKAEIVGVSYNGATDHKNVLFYTLKYNGKNIKIRRDDIFKFSELFNLNFKVIKDKQGIPYIAAKPGGVKASEIKAEVVTLVNTDDKRKKVPVNRKLDLIGLFDVAQKLEATTVMNTGLTHMGAVIINTPFTCKPRLKFSSKNLNINITGTLSGSCVASGKAFPVKAFKTISIVKDMKVEKKEVMFAVPSRNALEFTNAVAGSVGASIVTSKLKKSHLDAIKEITGDDVTVFEVDISHLPVMNEASARENIIPADELTSLVGAVNVSKICKNLVNKSDSVLRAWLISRSDDVSTDDKKESLGAARTLFKGGVVDTSKLFDAYKNESMETLGELLEIGVNIYTGFYEESGSYTRGKDDTAIEIEYSNKYSKIESMKKFTDDYKSGKIEIPEGVKQIFRLVESKGSTGVVEYANERSIIADEASRKIALHKFAMCSLSGCSEIHSHDANKWMLDTKYRGRGNRYILKGCADGVVCVCKNISIMG